MKYISAIVFYYRGLFQICLINDINYNMDILLFW